MRYQMGQNKRISMGYANDAAIFVETEDDLHKFCQASQTMNMTISKEKTFKKKEITFAKLTIQIYGSV